MRPSLVWRAVFDEAVAVAVAVVVHPVQRRLDVRPQPLRERDVAGALEMRAGQRHEERRRIDAAVVAAERHLAEDGHFAIARFVQDLAGLRVGMRVDGGGLRRRQMPEHAGGDGGIEPQRRQGGDQGVATEHGAEPRHARVGVGPLGSFRQKHVEIGDAAADGFVEAFVARGYLRGAFRGALQGALAVAQRNQERALSALAGDGAAGDFDEDRTPFAGREIDDEFRAPARKLRWRRIEADRRLAPGFVEPEVNQPHMVVADFGNAERSAARARRAAHFEDVGEIGGEGDLELQIRRGSPIEIARGDPFQAAAVP